MVIVIKCSEEDESSARSAISLTSLIGEDVNYEINSDIKYVIERKDDKGKVTEWFPCKGFEEFCISLKSMVSIVQCENAIKYYGLIPHPEGGFFKEIYRSAAPPMESMGKTDERGRLIPALKLEGRCRNEYTSIYWMATSKSHLLYMGRNLSPHIHYYHSGAPYRYILIHPSGEVQDVIMGPNPELDHVQQMVVGTDVYKCGCFDEKDPSLDYRYFLVGEGVAPGFDYRDFIFVSTKQLLERLTDATDASVFKFQLERLKKFIHPNTEDRDFDRFYDEVKDS